MNTNDEQDEIATLLEKKISRHLKNRTKFGDFSDPTVAVQKLNYDSGEAYLKAELNVTLNGRHVFLRASAKQMTLARGVGRGLGLIGEWITLLIALPFSTNDEKHSPVMKCVEQIASEYCMRIDHELGVPIKPSDRLWGQFQIARWSFSALYFGSVWIYLFLHEKVDDPSQQLIRSGMFALIPSASLFCLLYCLNLLCMPTRFFETTPTGKLALSRSGLSSVIAMRILCAVLSCILGLAFSGLNWIAFEVAKEPVHR